jgi:hypothetical protein
MAFFTAEQVAAAEGRQQKPQPNKKRGVKRGCAVEVTAAGDASDGGVGRHATEKTSDDDKMPTTTRAAASGGTAASSSAKKAKTGHRGAASPSGCASTP